MAVEDHPRFREWLAAQKRLTQAREAYLAATTRADETSLKAKFDDALGDYKRISEEIGIAAGEPIPGVDDLF